MTEQPTLFADPATRGRCPFCRQTVTLEILFTRHYRCGRCGAGLLAT